LKNAPFGGTASSGEKKAAFESGNPNCSKERVEFVREEGIERTINRHSRRRTNSVKKGELQEGGVVERTKCRVGIAWSLNKENGCETEGGRTREGSAKKPRQKHPKFGTNTGKRKRGSDREGDSLTGGQKATLGRKEKKKWGEDLGRS